MRYLLAAALLSAMLLPGCTSAPSTRANAATQPDRFRVLVFSKTAGFRHDCIPAGVEAIKSLGTKHGFDVDTTEDAASFTPENLARYDVLVFMCTTGDVLNETQQTAMENFMKSGRGFVGVHSAADTEYDWPWYGWLIGTYFKSHPPVQQATVIAVEPRASSTAHLPPRWTRTDEWYDFRDTLGMVYLQADTSTPDPFDYRSENGDPNMRILLIMELDSYQGHTMHRHHPIAWQQGYDGGRAWYTGLGHTVESYSEPLFLDHLAGGILWAAGRAD